jgi:nicotinic acid mononucleotide adenylyltransferase
MRRAADEFSLDETMALAGCANADKASYDCALEDRLRMLALTFADHAQTSIALCSHAYFVDVAEALLKACGHKTLLHFIIGFDTFERVLDRDGRYFQNYHLSFNDRLEALDHLLERSRLVVAGRSGAGRSDFERLVEEEGRKIAARVAYVELPADLGERSATEVRQLVRARRPIAGLVPRQVERYIEERNLYR